MSEMECSCSCDYYDGDFEPIVSIGDGPKLVTARKQYRCCECYDIIAPGDLYEVWRYINREAHKPFGSFRTCAPCAAIRRDFGCSWGGGLVDEVYDCLGFDYRFPVEDDE